MFSESLIELNTRVRSCALLPAMTTSQHRLAPRAFSATKHRASITHWDWDDNPDAVSSAEYLAAKGRRGSLGANPTAAKGWRRVATCVCSRVWAVSCGDCIRVHICACLNAVMMQGAPLGAQARAGVPLFLVLLFRSMWRGFKSFVVPRESRDP